MKLQLTFAVLASVLLASALGFSASARQQDPVQQRLDAMQKDILDSRTRVEQMVEELKGARKTLDEAQKYIDAQAKAAKALVEVLDAAEKAGFTFGINPESRELLLKGWREELDTLQQGVPTPLPAPKDPKDPKDAKKPEEKKP
jgi:HAMP domain-containing protein